MDKESYKNAYLANYLVALVSSYAPITSFLLVLFPSSIWHRPSCDLCRLGTDADGSASSALLGTLHSNHQLCCGSLEKGACNVLDGQRLCGEYQFDMSVFKKY